MKMAWPWPAFMVVKHIAQVLLGDLTPLLGNKRPDDEGVGVLGVRGRQSEFLAGTGDRDGGSKTAVDGDESSSSVLGT